MLSRHGALSHSLTGSYDLWIVRLVAIRRRCDRSSMFATISSNGRSHTAIDIYARSRYINWENIDGLSVVAINDRCTTIHDGWLPIARSIDRCLLRPTVRAIVASCDRSYDNSWHPVTELTINRGTRRPMVRSLVGCNDRLHVQS